MIRRRPLIGLTLMAIALGACAADDAASRPLSAEGQRGRTTASDVGCATCHGASGSGGAAPGFLDMWGTEITLDDGTVVTYDAEYVTRAIRDPQAQTRPDVSKVPMAAYDASKVTDAQLAEILAFIEDLGPVASTPVTTSG